MPIRRAYAIAMMLAINCEDQPNGNTLKNGNGKIYFHDL